MLAEIFLLVITFYLLYRFVFNFLVPVIRTTRHVKQQFRNMHDAMGGQQQHQQQYQQQQHQQQQQQPQQSKNWQDRHSSTKGAADDYIEFEEIRK